MKLKKGVLIINNVWCPGILCEHEMGKQIIVGKLQVFTVCHVRE